MIRSFSSAVRPVLAIRARTKRFPTRELLKGMTLALGMVAAVGCRDHPTVVVYSALDSQFSEPILDDFTQKTGIRVRSRFDTESTKTVGLTEMIINEARAGNSRCDLFWNNEILHTLRLQKRGLLEVYLSPSHRDYSAQNRAPDHTWHGFAARARVLIVNTDLVAVEDYPDSILDLADPSWRDRAALAKPLFGTTATHAACLFARWGDERAKAFFRKVRDNGVSIESGNKQVALRVAAGQCAIGLTDTDDAMVLQEAGWPIAIVYPDRAEDQIGTLFIPNTLAIIKGSPHTKEARQLVDYLLTPEIETRLAQGPSAQIPLNPKAQAAARVPTPADGQAMAVDFVEAAEHWDVASKFFRTEFLAPRP